MAASFLSNRSLVRSTSLVHTNIYRPPNMASIEITTPSAGTNAAGSASHVFDDDLLAEAIPHPFSQNPPNRVRGSTRGKSNDKSDRARRVFLSTGQCRK
jgi:hypothetical protein